MYDGEYDDYDNDYDEVVEELCNNGFVTGRDFDMFSACTTCSERVECEIAYHEGRVKSLLEDKGVDQENESDY